MKVIEVGWTDYSSSIKYVATLLSRKQKRLNYASGKADSAFTTVLDMLNVENDTILYALIDINSIEKML